MEPFGIIGQFQRLKTQELVIRTKNSFFTREEPTGSQC